MDVVATIRFRGVSPKHVAGLRRMLDEDFPSYSSRVKMDSMGFEHHIVEKPKPSRTIKAPKRKSDLSRSAVRAAVRANPPKRKT